jgi:hypothetical protein
MSKRICLTCQSAVVLYPQCKPCREKGCAHEVTHYDSTLRSVCNACGIEVQPRKKRSGYNFNHKNRQGLRLGSRWGKTLENEGLKAGGPESEKDPL